MSDKNTFKPAIGMKLFICSNTTRSLKGHYEEVIVKKVGNKFFYVDKAENNNGEKYNNNIKCEVKNSSLKGVIGETVHSMGSEPIFEDFELYEKYIGWKNLTRKFQNVDFLEGLPDDVKKQIFNLCLPFDK